MKSVVALVAMVLLVGAVGAAAPTLTYVVANELPYESSPAKVAVIVYCPTLSGFHCKPYVPL